MATFKLRRETSAGVAILALLVILGISLRFTFLVYHRAQFETEIAAYASSIRIGGIDAAFDWTLRLGPLSRAFHMLIVHISFGSTLVVALLEAITATIICLPIVVLSKQLYPSASGAGLAGAALYAFHPQAIVYCCFFLDHQQVTALALIAFVLLAQRWTEGSSYWRSLLCGATLGLLGLSRAIMLAAIVPLISRISWAATRHRAPLVHALLIVFAVAGVLAPWIYRQSHSSGVFVPVSSGGGVTLLWGTLLDYSKPRYQLQGDILRIVDEMRTREGIEMIAAGPADDARAARAAADKIRARPSQWLLGVFYKAGAFWYSDHTRLRTWLDLSINVPLLILGAAGVVSAAAKGRAVVFVAGVLLSINMAYAFLHSMAQYSTPVLPLLSVLASGPMASLATRIGRGR